MTHMNAHDRYIILKQGYPVYTSNTVAHIIAYLWGKPVLDHITHQPLYTILDYEKSYLVDAPNLSALWSKLYPNDHVELSTVLVPW